MKRTSLLLVALTIVMSLGFTAADDQVAKIYVFGDYLIRSNTAQGRIDFFDLRQPSTLPKLASIHVEGNNDVAVIDGIMYADAGRDLIVFDISDATGIRALDTIRGVFSQLYRPEAMPVMNEGETTGGMSGCGGCGSDVVSSPEVAMGGDRASGVAGSLARFAIANGHLYCIDYSDVIAFDVEMPRRPQLKNRVSINWEIETLFPHENTLFVGGRRGVYLVDITDGDEPAPISQFEHGRGCDPVVVENDRAYVTLRSGTTCGDVTDQLHILDVADLRAPRLLASVDVDNPYGLAVRDGIVYLCDGTGGLKIIDTRDPQNSRTIGVITGIVPHDAILLGSKLVVTTADRATVYDIGTAAPTAMGSISLRE